MRKLLWLLGLFLALNAQGQLTFETNELRFERRAEDKKVEGVFKFRNDSGVPVTIRSLRGSCGCTTASLEKKTYAPGESGEIKATFKFGFRTGWNVKDVTVRYEDEKLPEQKLRLNVTIGEAVKLKPKLVFWRVGSEPEMRTIRVQIEAGVRLADVKSSNDLFQVAFEEEKERVYSVSVVPTSTAKAAHAVIDLETAAGGGNEARTYQAYARVQ
jgi:hypothetical protein